MTKDIEQSINKLISSNKIMIFSKTYCPFSNFVKEVFNALREKYNVLEFDTMKDGKLWQTTLTGITGCKTVPQVFVYGSFIGGAQETEALLKKGELQKIIKLKVAADQNSASKPDNELPSTSKK